MARRALQARQGEDMIDVRLLYPRHYFLFSVQLYFTAVGIRNGQR